MTNNFINMPEMNSIKEFLKRTQRGIQFSGRSSKMLGDQVLKIFGLSGIQRITELILLLDMMANAKEYKYHSSIGYSKIINTYDFYRFNKIHEHIILILLNKSGLKMSPVRLIYVLQPFADILKNIQVKLFSLFLMKSELAMPVN